MDHLGRSVPVKEYLNDGVYRHFRKLNVSNVVTPVQGKPTYGHDGQVIINLGHLSYLNKTSYETSEFFF